MVKAEKAAKAEKTRKGPKKSWFEGLKLSLIHI